MSKIANKLPIACDIADRLVNGQNCSEIAREYGVHPDTVRNMAKSDTVRAMVEEVYNNIVKLAPAVHTIYQEELTRKPDGVDDRKIRLQVAKEVASISGISPVRDSRSSVFLQQILAPVSVQLSPIVATAIQRLLAPPTEDVIDTTEAGEGPDRESQG